MFGHMLSLLRRHRRISLLAPLAVLICSFAGVAVTQGAAAPSNGRAITNSATLRENLRHATATSSNWAGYAVTAAAIAPIPTAPATTPPVDFSNVSGGWVQPAVT
jgi:hypothetical protein